MKSRCLMGLTTLSLALLALPAVASVILYDTGFEPPTFVPGPLLGQDGWFAGLGADAVTVSTELPRNGIQSVRVNGSQLEEFFGFHFGSYARELNYDPIGSGTPIVDIFGNMNLTGSAPTCGNGLGLTGILNGEFVPNALIGIREQNGEFVSYLSNFDGVFVNGPGYEFGEWASVRAVFDFGNRTVRGFFNDQLMGEIPFTSGIGNDIFFVNMSLGSSEPIPNVIAYFDDLSVTAVPEPSSLLLWGIGSLGVIGYDWRRRKRA